MSQNVWATIMPFGLVTLIFYWPKIFFRAGQRLALISSTDGGSDLSKYIYYYQEIVCK
jgi:hypothetical protein